MLFKRNENLVVKTLIELLDKNMLSISKHHKVKTYYFHNAVINTDGNKWEPPPGVARFDITVSENWGLALPFYQIYDSISKQTTVISKKDFKNIISAIEKRDDNIIINEMKKMLEYNNNKVLEEGRKLTQDVSN